MKLGPKRPHRSFVTCVWALATVTTACLLVAQTRGDTGRLTRITVHGESLEDNVTGDSPDRAVSVYLPPGYDPDGEERYPVLYLLHGIADTDQTWTAEQGPWASIPKLMDAGIAAEKVPPMIVVMPNQRTKLLGSFYRNSTATGNWEDFTVKELVGHIDRTYRTIPKPEGRGLAGHSMGGHGAIYLGMRHPDVFGAIYALSPAVLGWGGELSVRNPAFRKTLAADKPADLIAAGELYPAGVACVAQAFSPNPDRPPFYADFPCRLVDGKLRPDEPAFSKWETSFPLYMLTEHREKLARLRGIRFDAGTGDQFAHIPVNCRELSFRLTNLGLDHTYDEYDGDHRNRLWGESGRLYTIVLPYFGEMLGRGP